MLMPLKRYADFSGRSRRKEYWMFVLFQVLLVIPFVLVLGLSGSLEEGSEPGGFAMLLAGLLGLIFLGLFIPSLAVQVRRLHDTDRSGWWILLGIIPFVNYIGFIVLLVFYCLDGSKGENRFGADPKMNQNVGNVFE